MSNKIKIYMHYQGRIQYFDQIKAIAILMVIMGHVLQWTFGVEDSLLITILSTIDLPIFFYIAGFFSINHKKEITLGGGHY